jgi:bla regulator protein blaR1
MNSIVQILVAVLNSLWQAAIVAALVWLVLKFARRRNLAMNAATRYVVWWAALGVVLVLPAAPGALALWRTRAAHTPSSTAAPKAVQPVLPAANFDAPALITLREQRSTRWPFWVLAIWSVVFLYRLVEIVRSYFYLRGVKRRAAVSLQPLPEKKRSAHLLLSGEVASPMAVGFLRPAVILPETLPAEITGEELHHVLLHEYAHLARRDDWSNLIAHLLGAALALHPAAWWILRQIAREREMACDDWVVARTGSARPYAASLARLSELRWSRRQQAQGEALASGMFGGGSRLGERIELLLKSGAGNPARSRLSGGLLAAALVAFAIAVSPAPRWIAFAQRAPGPGFEVASIKPGDPDTQQFSILMAPGGRLSAKNASLRMLIGWAYDIRDYQISGGPGWVGANKYNVEAKPETGVSIPPGPNGAARVRLMTQSLLAGRFKLNVHRETRQGPVYELVVGKGGPKLKEAAKAGLFTSQGLQLGRGQVTGRAARVSQLANRLSQEVGRPVFDRTGLAATYDFSLKWTPDPVVQLGIVQLGKGPDPATLPDTDGPSIFTALQEQLGLKLQPAKGPVEILIIDHAEKPDAN